MRKQDGSNAGARKYDRQKKLEKRVKILEEMVENYKERIDLLTKSPRPKGLTAEDLMQALEHGDVPHDAEIRIEFSGDDNTPQELVGIERRESEGRRYICIMVRNV
jgi:vacuolar-type H+-ATPase subunit E/Vma4